MKATIASFNRRAKVQWLDSEPPATNPVQLNVPRLAREDVHVWRASLDAPPPRVSAWLQALLSPDENERAARFFFERDRRRFIVGRGILRSLLGAYLGRRPGEIRFCYGPNGKPALAEVKPGERVFFNVAHSEDAALFAFARAGEIGVDIERVRPLPDWQAIAEASFGPDELIRLRRCPEAARREEFFRAWTRQEALLKATGVGLGGNGGAEGADDGFLLHAFDPGPGFVAALAVPRHTGRSSIHSFCAEDRGLKPVLRTLS
jgi:4'-phosphopantetheinyl transferase